MWNRIATGVACAFIVAAGARAPAAAQDSTAAPAPYRLVTVAGKPLPTVVEQEGGCREEVTAGSLTLRTDGTWLLETSTREVCGDRTETESDADDGRYTTEGRAVRFLDEDGNPDSDHDRDGDIDLDDLTTATLAADGTLTAKLDDGRTTLVFRR